jgi:hypothetical protein
MRRIELAYMQHSIWTARMHECYSPFKELRCSLQAARCVEGGRRDLYYNKIVINGRFLSQAVTGVQRYAHELLREIDLILADRLSNSGSVEVLVPPNLRTYPTYKSLALRKVGRLTGQLWEQLELPFHCRGKLLFTPCGGAPLLHHAHVVTIPDAAVFATPHAYSRRYGAWYRWLHTRMARNALRVITVSEFSRSELV